MHNLQDKVIQKVQQHIKDELSGIITDFNVERISEDIEMKILSVFYEFGITSQPKKVKHD